MWTAKKTVCAICPTCQQVTDLHLQEATESGTAWECSFCRGKVEGAQFLHPDREQVIVESEAT